MGILYRTKNLSFFLAIMAWSSLAIFGTNHQATYEASIERFSRHLKDEHFTQWLTGFFAKIKSIRFSNTAGGNYSLLVLFDPKSKQSEYKPFEKLIQKENPVKKIKSIEYESKKRSFDQMISDNVSRMDYLDKQLPHEACWLEFNSTDWQEVCILAHIARSIEKKASNTLKIKERYE